MSVSLPFLVGKFLFFARVESPFGEGCFYAAAFEPFSGKVDVSGHPLLSGGGGAVSLGGGTGGVPYVPLVFAFMTFIGGLKSSFRDIAAVFRSPMTSPSR